MIPQTLGALVLFLLLVPPGLVFELLRKDRRNSREETESAFREASRVAVGSLAFSSISTILLFIVQKAGAALFGWGYVVDVKELVTRGSAYVQEHIFLLVGSAAGELVLALVLVLGFNQLLSRRSGPFLAGTSYTAWTQVFRVDRPPSSVPWAHVQLDDGTSFYGYVRSYSPEGKMDEREIVLEGAGLTYVGPAFDGGSTVTKEVIGHRWERVVIPGSQIRYVRVTFIQAEDEPRTPPAARAPEERDGKPAEDSSPDAHGQ